MEDRRRAIFVNKGEESLFEILERIVPELLPGARPFPKIGLMDSLRLKNSGLPDTTYTYALKAHTDFLVVETCRWMPLFAVEHDEIYHEQCEWAQLNDRMKNEICTQLILPTLRIKEGQDAEAAIRKYIDDRWWSYPNKMQIFRSSDEEDFEEVVATFVPYSLCADTEEAKPIMNSYGRLSWVEDEFGGMLESDNRYNDNVSIEDGILRIGSITVTYRNYFNGMKLRYDND